MESQEQDTVDRLLDRWEKARERDEPLAVDDLCRAHADLRPEVQRRIDALLSLAPFLGPGRTGAAPSDGPPGRIGAYEVVGELERGGMGVVYRCRQQHPRREVAVKIIRPGRASDETLKRFQLEAQVLGMLRHPGIAQVYDAGTADFGSGTRPYLVMELIEGLPIDQHADQHRLDTVQRLKLLLEVCRAVDYAHKKGVIHRDLKPNNILVDEQGQPKILDFGIARITGSEFETLTGGFETLTPVGSLPYMSPEQAAACPGDVDTRTDVYSLGVVAYKLLAGRLPHDAKNRSLLEFVRVVTEEAARPLGQFNRAYRGDLETLVAKALEKDRKERYQSAAEFAADLSHYLAGEPVMARPVGQAGQFWHWCKRNRLVTGLAASLLVALIVGTAASTYFAVRADSALQETTVEKQRADRQRDLALARGREAEHQAQLARDRSERIERAAYDAQLALVDQIHLSDPLLGLEWLEDTQRCPRHLRGFAWHLLHCFCARRRFSLEGHTRQFFSVAFSADGRSVAAMGSDHMMRLWDTTTGQLRANRQGTTAGTGFIVFSPDGLLAASPVARRGMRIWDTATIELQAPLPGHDEPVLAGAFSPDGRLLATADRAGVIKIWDVEQKSELRTFREDGHLPGAIGFLADGATLVSVDRAGSIRWWTMEAEPVSGSLASGGKRYQRVVLSPDAALVATSSRYSAEIWETESGRLLATLTHGGIRAPAVAFAPDGKTVATAGGKHAIKLWDSRSWQLRTTLRDDADFVCCVAFAPDGRMLASAGEDRLVKLWNVNPERAHHTLKDHGGPVRLVCYAPDGKTLACAGDDGVILLRNRTGKTVRATLSGHEGAVRCLAFSAAEAILASAGPDRTVKLWDAATGAPLAPLARPNHDVRTVAFSPDGDTLASSGRAGTIQLWDLPTRKLRRTLRGHEHTVYSVAFHPGGCLLASAGVDRAIRLWDPETGAPQAMLTGHRLRVTSVAFSPDGTMLASGSADRTARLWNVETGAVLALLEGHTDHVLAVAFSPDGQTLATAGRDSTVRLWDTATGLQQVAIHEHTEAVRCVAFSPDGTALASCGDDAALKFWHAGEPGSPSREEK
ncbi:MAG: WD40 repeat domain-containing serine/threonine protein kinase [Pirellulales bacterium]